ncbi:hypothetical protein PGT21_023662 [Puccinia graminis f. sp. tritici]|uniref:Uncharacterized protein n=1 Tax=Puccinia graminis f. sp. tritici TaxID=56615 RepID=A0A5B0PNH0_PUCGR|nr:hypothetical protein PGT21_023662 [Puccinia graminis f. sp. tritici]
MMFHISRAAAPQQHLSQESRCNCLGCNMDEWKLQPNALVCPTHAASIPPSLRAVGGLHPPNLPGFEYDPARAPEQETATRS